MVLGVMVTYVFRCNEKIFRKMKIDKKLIKELVENLKEFEFTELEYQDGPTKIKVSKVLSQLNKSKLVLLFLKIKRF